MPVSAEPDAPQTKPLWRRLLAGTLVLSAAALAMLVAVWVTESRSSTSRLKAMMDDLDKTDPDWRFHEIEAAREEVPEAENSARVVVAVHKMIPRTWRWQEIGQERVEELRSHMTSVEPILPEARRLAGMPRGRYRLEITENPLHTPLVDQQLAGSVGTLLALDAVHRAHKGEFDLAVTSCRAAFNAGRSLGDEPLVNSMSFRIACWKTAGDAVERVLSLGAAGEPELAKLAALLAEEEKHPALYLGLRGGRGLLHLTMTGLAEGRFPLADGSIDGPALVWRERLAGWHLKLQVRREHPEMLDLLTRAVAAAKLPVHEQHKPMEDLDREVERHRSRGTNLTLPMFMHGIAATAERFHNGKAMLRSLRSAVAAERYRLAKGEWPASLNDLVPAYLDGVPLDPFDGAPLRYLRLPEGVAVYSAGPDGKDDGGNLDRKTPFRRGADVGYRLWDVKHRGGPAAGKK